VQADAVNGRDVDRAAYDLAHFLKLACELLVAVKQVLGAVVELLPFGCKMERFWLRSMMTMPKPRSIALSCWLTADCVMPLSLAALEKLWLSTRSQNIFSFQRAYVWPYVIMLANRLATP
jgi:hypothetical protein